MGKKRSEKGQTFLEMIIVLIGVGILATSVYLVATGMIDRGRQAILNDHTTKITRLYETWKANGGQFTPDGADAPDNRARRLMFFLMVMQSPKGETVTFGDEMTKKNAPQAPKFIYGVVQGGILGSHGVGVPSPVDGVSAAIHDSCRGPEPAWNECYRPGNNRVEPAVEKNNRLACYISRATSDDSNRTALSPMSLSRRASSDWVNCSRVAGSRKCLVSESFTEEVDWAFMGGRSSRTQCIKTSKKYHQSTEILGESVSNSRGGNLPSI